MLCFSLLLSLSLYLCLLSGSPGFIKHSPKPVFYPKARAGPKKSSVARWKLFRRTSLPKPPVAPLFLLLLSVSLLNLARGGSSGSSAALASIVLRRGVEESGRQFCGVRRSVSVPDQPGLCLKGLSSRSRPPLRPLFSCSPSRLLLYLLPFDRLNAFSHRLPGTLSQNPPVLRIPSG